MYLTCYGVVYKLIVYSALFWQAVQGCGEANWYYLSLGKGFRDVGLHYIIGRTLHDFIKPLPHKQDLIYEKKKL